MMGARPATQFLVQALIRRANAEGGVATVLKRGDSTAGAVLILAMERGRTAGFLERGLGPDGAPTLVHSGPKSAESEAEISEYWAKRCRNDPDLWVVELDIADPEPFAADLLLFG
ncbi:DUF1491 family protein [Stakelama sediminis]|uniref:DUF1491 family protein n=1 Tax=Stakelama sediminis TaxID=463200 RepID=A0A840Z250_9SPHN|nr:DUF1491 family protein [Stakelama sediminis]MBB5719810.1 hypothetical protein [Stakelama sediminis]